MPRSAAAAVRRLPSHPLDRRPGTRRADFTIDALDTYYEKGTPKFLGAQSLGVARSA
jgi:hypothetical protein